MKKFTFSLQAVLKLKGTQRDQKQTELAKAQAKLDELNQRKKELTVKQEENGRQYAADMENGISAFQIAWYDDFDRYLNIRILKTSAMIREAQRAAEQKKTELVELMRGIKALEKLKEDQYRTYLKEAERQEEKILGDLMSFKNASGGGLMLEMA